MENALPQVMTVYLLRIVLASRVKDVS